MGWIKMSERKPDRMGWVILSDGYEVTTGYYDTDYFVGCEHDTGTMTYWMPLPAVPKEKEQHPKTESTSYVIAELLAMMRILQDNAKKTDERIKRLEEQVNLVAAVQRDKLMGNNGMDKR